MSTGTNKKESIIFTTGFGIAILFAVVSLVIGLLVDTVSKLPSSPSQPPAVQSVDGCVDDAAEVCVLMNKVVSTIDASAQEYYETHADYVAGEDTSLIKPPRVDVSTDTDNKVVSVTVGGIVDSFPFEPVDSSDWVTVNLTEPDLNSLENYSLTGERIAKGGFLGSLETTADLNYSSATGILISRDVERSTRENAYGNKCSELDESTSGICLDVLAVSSTIDEEVVKYKKNNQEAGLPLIFVIKATSGNAAIFVDGTMVRTVILTDAADMMTPKDSPQRAGEYSLTGETTRGLFSSRKHVVSYDKAKDEIHEVE